LSASNAPSSSPKARRGARPGKAASSSSTAERFTLTGPSLRLDPRVHAYRRDIADIALAGQLFAPHYARPVVKVAGPGASAVWIAQSAQSELASELRDGDEFAVLDVAGDWAWGYRVTGHGVGYVPAAHLRD